MDEAEARQVLGVGAQTAPGEVRATFRRLVRHSHPDVVPGDAEASRATAALVEAYAVLRRTSSAAAIAAPAAPAPTARRATHPGEVVNHGDSLLVDGPPDEVYRHLVDVAHLVGEITYLDPDARLLDTIVTTDEGAACSLLASFQGRAGATEVFFSIEPLGGERRPPVEPLVRMLAELLSESG
ncbi:MAG TPA: J domain-containing protein [Acidimicrobiales bacterium]|nr:J domain-containing protein [Acidimicrobiales bacterium]